MSLSDHEFDPWSDTTAEHPEPRDDPRDEWPEDTPVAAGVVPGFGRLGTAATRSSSSPGAGKRTRWFAVSLLSLALVVIVVAVVNQL